MNQININPDGYQALNRLHKLIDGLPTRDSQNGQYLYFPLSQLSMNELNNHASKLQDFFRNDTEVTFNINENRGINIPMDLLAGLNEEKASQLFGILDPIVEIEVTCAHQKTFLESISGIKIVRFATIEDEENPEYMMYFNRKGITDPIMSLPRVLNEALGDNLFYESVVTNPSLLALAIRPEDTDKLLNHPNLNQAISIFKNPHESIANSRQSNLSGWFQNAMWNVEETAMQIPAVRNVLNAVDNYCSNIHVLK